MIRTITRFNTRFNNLAPHTLTRGHTMVHAQEQPGSLQSKRPLRTHFYTTLRAVYPKKLKQKRCSAIDAAVKSANALCVSGLHAS